MSSDEQFLEIQAWCYDVCWGCNFVFVAIFMCTPEFIMRFFCNRMYIYVCSKFFFGIARVAQLMQFFSISYVILDPVNFR